MGKVGDEADPQWFLGDGEDDGNGSSRLLYCSDCAAIRDNDIDLLPHELSRYLGHALGPPFGPAGLDRDGATLDPAEFSKSLDKSGCPRTKYYSSTTQVPDGRQLVSLLGVCAKRPRCC